jgi:hypothetical protein
LLSARTVASGRPRLGRSATTAATARSARGVDLQNTACYTCTGVHTCLVFLTESGIRLPLCETCLRQIVPRAIETS